MSQHDGKYRTWKTAFRDVKDVSVYVYCILCGSSNYSYYFQVLVTFITVYVITILETHIVMKVTVI